MGRWDLVRLGDVCRIAKTKHDGQPLPYVGMEHIESGTGQLVVELTPTAVKSATFRFDERHVLYGRLRPYLNKVLVPDFEGHCSTEVFPLECDSRLDRRFLFYWLTDGTTVRRIERTSTGARMPRANVNAVLGFSLLLPPLLEQERIVAILDEAFAAIATATVSAEKNLANARELFGNQLDAVISDASVSATEVTLAELATDITDGDHQPPPKSSDGLPFITISDIDKVTHTIDFSSTFKVPDAYHAKLKPNRKPRRGDLLYTVTGSFGIPVIVDTDRDFCFQRHIGLIRPAEDVSTRWLYYVLLTLGVRKQAESAATGTAQKTVSLRALRAFRVSKLPFTQQQRVVELLDTLVESTSMLASLYDRKKAAVTELRQSILHKAFTGELTADPNAANRALTEAEL